ncbi:3-methylornithyl-N6-L-lysine dehydrogenase PylD [Acidobacteriota bacterium]
MTRLKSFQIASVAKELEAYDDELLQKTGLSLRQIAARAAGTSEDALFRAFQKELAAVIPVTTGKGIIKGFTQAVAGIINYMGCPCLITAAPNVAGLAEGIERGASLVFLADDHRFVAIKFSESRVVDNAAATAWGYAFALDALVGGLKGRNVLLIGAGKVGKNALCALSHLGAKPGVFDIDQKKAAAVSAKFSANLEENLAAALRRYQYFFDASPSPDFILPKHVKSETAIAACGIPLGLTEEARIQAEESLIHDPLQLGTATMLCIVAGSISGNKRGGQIGRIA